MYIVVFFCGDVGGGGDGGGGQGDGGGGVFFADVNGGYVGM